MSELNTKKFGVEIECYLPQAPLHLRPADPGPYATSHELGSFDLGCRQAAYKHFASKLVAAGIPAATTNAYHSNYHTGTGNMTTWLISHDSSIGNRSGKFGAEIVSPPLKGKMGMELLRKVCKILQQSDVIADDTCGLHVHHEADTYSFKTEKLGLFFLKHQAALFSMIKKQRLENYHCQPLTEMLARRSVTAIPNDRNERRYALNFKPLEHGHIEFRLHHGTVRYADISNWIVLTQKMVEVSQVGALGPTGWLHRLKEILEQGPVDLVELQRILSNQDIDRTVEELNVITRRYAFITRIEGAGGSVTCMIAQNKTPIDELIEALNITDVELATLMHGKAMLRNHGHDSDATIVRAHPKRRS